MDGGRFWDNKFTFCCGMVEFGYKTIGFLSITIINMKIFTNCLTLKNKLILCQFQIISPNN